MQSELNDAVPSQVFPSDPRRYPAEQTENNNSNNKNEIKPSWFFAFNQSDTLLYPKVF